MSESGTEQSGGSFSSSAGGSSLASNNTDTRALNSLQEGPEGDAADDLGSNNKSIQEGLFATLYTLTKQRALDTSLRVAALRVVFEFLQFFRVVFNFSFPWVIQRDLWAFKAIEWVLFRPLLVHKGYDAYISLFYFLAGLIFATLLLTAWIAVVLKGSDTVNKWLGRLIGVLQLAALLLFVVAWPVVLDFIVFLFDCEWTNIAAGSAPTHVFFTDHSCIAMPHLAHMLFAGVTVLLLIGMVLLMGMGTCDMNPLNRSWLSSSDAATTMKMLVLKVIFVLVSTVLDFTASAQAGIMAVAMFGVVYYMFDGVPFYNNAVNVLWGGLWMGILDVTVILLVMVVTAGQQADPAGYQDMLTQYVLWTIFPAVALGAVLMWLRVRRLQGLCAHLHNSFNKCKATAMANLTVDDQARNSGSVVAFMGDLRKVYHFRDVRQVQMMCRSMRRWDEEGEPEAEAVEFAEFLIKCGMARMPNNPALLVMNASFMIEAKKDGQAARTQLQLALKASPSLLDNYFIFVCNQLSKQLTREGDGLDLLSYVEFQRNYMACVRAHKAALLAQRTFWNALLRDPISFRDLQANVQAMEAAEQKATAIYRRVMERYPNNGRVMRIYGRFLEFVRSEPGAASRFYEAALKQGTTESLLSLMNAEGGAAGLSAAGPIEEKEDGLVVINAQGIILMVNPAASGMFGYQKGELEGKNVSVMMPQPFSARHDSFLQRYVESGQPHILNKCRSVVALHKDRSMFPVTLCVARLSGAGTDSLFVGLLRPQPVAGTADDQTVKFWTTAAGLIMCADKSMTDVLGIQAGELVGRSFSNLTTDVEGVNRFLAMVAEAAEGPDDSTLSTRPTFKTKMLHGFMSPVDVELSVEFGGAIERGSDFRALIIHAHVLTEATAVMVVDHKGRLLHATAKLSMLLGHPVARLTKMELNALLPQPTCQMHGAWMKEPPTQGIPPTSCRAGAVVHLLAANGTKVPVTCKISTKEDFSTGHPMHVVQVTKSSEEQRLDQQRMVLSVNHKATILAVNPGLAHSLFGVDGAELVGRPLSAVIDVFTNWKAGLGEELSLLELLVAGTTDATTGNADVPTNACAWRVGVHKPPAAGSDSQGGTTSTQRSSLLHALQPNKVRPACMTLEPTELQDMQDLLNNEALADTTPVLQVSLHRSDALSTVIELDKELRVGRVDDAAGLMFGVPAKQLLHRSFAKLVGLSDVKHFDDLLGNKPGAAKKGAMKKGAAPTSSTGVIRHVEAMHLGDGQPLSLKMQAMAYEQAGRVRHVVRLQLTNPVSAAFEKLLAMKGGRDAAAANAAGDTGPGAAAEDPAAGSPAARSPASSRSGGCSDADLAAEASGAIHSAAPAPTRRHDRVHEWVRQASQLEPEDDDRPDGPPSPKAKQQHRLARGVAMQEGDCEVAVRIPGRAGKGTPRCPTGPGRFDAGGSESDDDGFMGPDKSAPSFDRRSEGGASEGGASSFGGSMADGMSEAGASGVEPSSVATGAVGHEEELAVDMRRVKRLKKLMKMMFSGIAQAAANQWKRHTLLLLAVILAAHVACFAVTVTQLDARHANAVSVNYTALAAAAAGQVVLRLNFLHKCNLPEFQSFYVCQPLKMEDYKSRLLSRTAQFRVFHHNLYLGGDGLQPFRDPRLVHNWTFTQLPETLYYEVTGNGQPAFVNSTSTLWEMGNSMVSALSDVHYHINDWGPILDQKPQWLYASINGPGSLQSGYAWSLDTFTDYTWTTKLSSIIIVLLVIEAVVVQLSCMAYQFVLLQRCNVSHMRAFSVFLTLPSATVRFMVRRPMVVDDSANTDGDDDEDLDLVEGANNGGANTGTDAAAAGEGDASATDNNKKKSVRLAADGDNDRGKDTKEKQGPGSARVKSKSATSAKKPGSKQLSRLAAFKKKLNKTLFGWMDPKFKHNGKKLSPSSRVVWHFMAPLLLWVAAVAVIFGVSYSNLQGLQGPLASLDLSAHCLFRLVRVRLAANRLAFSVTDVDNAQYRSELSTELALFTKEYDTLLYGGDMMLQAEVSFNPVAPAAVFSNKAIADIFFKTTDCLRQDTSGCYQPGDEYYQITHSGLDAQVRRYMDEMATFANVPDALALANHSSYEYSVKVTALDTYDGLQKAADMFVAGTLERLEAVRQLHIILLVISLFCMVMFVVLLYRPYVKQLRRDTKAIVNMLSQLPAEVDVEGQVKSIVLGIVKTDGSRSMEGLLPGCGVPGGPMAGQLQPYGMGMMGAPQWGMDAPGAPGRAGVSGGGTWFGRRGANNNVSNGPWAQQNDPRMYGGRMGAMQYGSDMA